MYRMCNITRTWEALDARNAQTIRDYRAAKKAGEQWFSSYPTDEGRGSNGT
jgi:hypothetical protein